MRGDRVVPPGLGQPPRAWSRMRSTVLNATALRRAGQGIYIPGDPFVPFHDIEPDFIMTGTLLSDRLHD